MSNEKMGERAEVDVGAGDDARRRDRLLLAASFHQERRPVGDLDLVVAVFHAVVAMVRAHRIEPLLQEGDVLGATHEAHVRHRVDE